MFATSHGSKLWPAVLICGVTVAVRPAVADEQLAAEAARVLATRCLECHSDNDPQASLDLSRRTTALAGGESGVAITPGKAAGSLLWERVRVGEMPPEERQPLTAEERATLERWLAGGAPYATDVIDPNAYTSETRAGYDWWSLQPPQQPAVPPVSAADAHPIDAFVRRQLQAAGLTFSPPADAVTLLRRVSLDLIGLPPSPQDVQRFLEHPQGPDQAYEQWVDRLLASPQYGERWAQHWLDVIRWAETVGFETNIPRPNAWHYRDWVIDALNQDKPYDRFVWEQLAGDTENVDAALGFAVAGPANLPGQIGRDEEAMRQARQDELDEVIRTVSQGLLGLTMGCARCHDHKFDPLTQRDYYAMQAIFAGLRYGDRRLRGPQNEAWTAQVPDLESRLQKLRADLESQRERHQLRAPLQNVETESFAPVAAQAVRMQIAATQSGGAPSLYEFEAWGTTADDQSAQNVALATAGGRPSASSFALANQTRHYDNLVDGTVDPRQAFPWQAAQSGAAWIRVDFPQPVHLDRVVWHSGSTVPVDYTIDVLPPDETAWQTVATTVDRLPRIDDVRSAKQVQLAGLAADEAKRLLAITAAIRSTERERDRLAAGPQVYAASFSERPEPTWLLRRGDPMQQQEQVVPAIPVALGNLGLTAKAPESERRLALARHLTHRDHPLTSRVIVNRVWQHHFGTGLVATSSDFGKMGSRPSHPELLDWLAQELVRHGWSLKRLHRWIVTSRTYRQSSRPRKEALARDAEARLLWRFPPRRLEAEAIRDAILTTSGQLNFKSGGPGFDFFRQRGGLSGFTPHQTFSAEGWRRMVYAHKIRMQSVDVFGVFDCPDAGQMKPRRTQSITPVQSLGLLNSPFINRQERIIQESINETGEPSQRRNFLLQIDVDAAEKNLIDADISFIGSNGCVCRYQQHVKPMLLHRSRERIVMHTAATKHPASPGGQVHDSSFAHSLWQSVSRVF